MTYTERINNINVLKKEYLIYLQNLKKINNAFIISHLHQIYITPLLLLSNTTETIILKDNIIDLRKISSYYGTISPDFIQHPVGYFMEGILRNHNTDIFNIYLLKDTKTCKLFNHKNRRFCFCIMKINNIEYS